MWRNPDFIERNRRIFEEELDAFLPARLLDFHVHIFPAGTLPTGEKYDCAGHPIEKYDIEDLEKDFAVALPGREVSAVLLGLPNPEYDIDVNNRYLAAAAGRGRYYPFRLLDPQVDAPASLEADVRAGGFQGLKPYLTFARKADAEAVRIPDMLPEWAMETADALGLIVMLHIPGKRRLAAPETQREIAAYAKRYPNAVLVLAHIGRAYFLKNVLGNLEVLKEFPNIYVDLAMLNNWEVLEYTFKTVPPNRILYGTDAPIALAPGKSVEINDQYTYVTPTPWKLSISDEHGKLIFTSFLYEELRAIRKAVERLSLDRRFVRGIFYDNGMRLLARRDSEGTAGSHETAKPPEP